MDEKHCIYCGTTQNLNISHIIPDALTNANITNDCVCNDLHNSKMSDKFEGIVAEKLAFLMNKLDIKSSKSKSYPNYNATIEIEGSKYEAKKLKSSDDFIKGRKVIWNKEHTQVFGNIDTIKAIAKSYGSDEASVKIIDVNNIEFIKTIGFELEVFFSLEMYRLVAKIAFEWYCAQNKVHHKYEGFSEIINYIVDGVGENIVSIVSDAEINNKFNDYCNSGSHCLVGYISNKGDVNVFVDIFGLIIYNVKICNHIPAFCSNNCLLQKLNLDTTRQHLCLHDYNDLHSDMISSFSGYDSRFPQPIINGVRVCVPTMSKDVSGNLFFIGLLNNIGKGFSKEYSYTKEITDRLIDNIQKLLQASILHKRALKRFISDNIDFSKEIVINPNGKDKKSIFIYYFLLILGKENPDKMDNKILKKIILDKFDKYEFVITEEVYEQLKNTILQEENYSSIILLGAKKVLSWE